MTNGGDKVFLFTALASVNSMALGASALWGVRCTCTFPYQQPVLLCLICLACAYNMLYVCMSSAVQLYYVVSWSVGIETRRYTGSRESEKMIWRIVMSACQAGIELFHRVICSSNHVSILVDVINYPPYWCSGIRLF